MRLPVVRHVLDAFLVLHLERLDDVIAEALQNSGVSSPWNWTPWMQADDRISRIRSSRSFTKTATGTMNGGSWAMISAALCGSIYRGFS